MGSEICMEIMTTFFLCRPTVISGGDLRMSQTTAKPGPATDSPLLTFVLSAVWLCLCCFTGGESFARKPPIPAPPKPPKPPMAKKVARLDTIHGEVREDDYFWLRDKTDPGVLSYLKSENEYAESIMVHTQEFQEKLYQEMLSRIKETDLSVPEKLDDYYYYRRTEEGKQYRIHCRKKGSLEADEEIILDENALAENHDYFRIGVSRLSPDHRLLAYSVDTSGSEYFTIYVKDLTTGDLFEDVIKDVDDTIVWANDNRTIFYKKLDDIRRPFELFEHTLGTDPEDDRMLYREEDPGFWLGVSKSRSKQYLFMTLGSKTTSEFHFRPADLSTPGFQLIQSREHEIEYYVDHHGDHFYIITNENAKNFKMMKTSVSAPSKENWEEIIPHRKEVMIEGFELFRNHLVVHERNRGLEQIRVRNLESGAFHYVEFPEPVYTFWFSRNPDFQTDLLRFTYMSLVTPRSVYDYNMATRDRDLKKQYEVLGGYDPSAYKQERIFATADDSVQIPISLVYRDVLVRDGTNPMFLTGYGAYGASSDPYFSSNRLSMLDRGFIYAIAHVRGGGEMGRYWYDQGKLLNKMNSFSDFICCAEFLVSEKYTTSENLVIEGASAGGLLVGAVINMRPDLCRVVVAEVPFVDVMNTMLDPSIPLTILEYEEWGNPDTLESYNYIKAYSPYDNVEAKEYPIALIRAGLNDSRVAYWEPAKWAAKLRDAKTDDHLLLLKTNMGAGHGGASGRYDYLRDIAFDYAFLFDVFGIEE